MARSKPIELFMPPNMLKAKVGSGTPGLDLDAIARAEKAMDGLKGEFENWAAADVDRLMAAKARFAKTPDTAAHAALLRAAHDLKGQAATYDFPTIARVAGSLSKLLGELPDGRELPAGLVDAHVGAVHVIFRDKVKDTSNKMVQALTSELEKQVAAALD
jgi:chemotaxis protein histidine kinase CheA